MNICWRTRVFRRAPACMV